MKETRPKVDDSMSEQNNTSRPSRQTYTHSSIREVQANILNQAKAQDYEGYSKHDALNARWVEAAAGRTRLPRLLAIQLVMRCPFHIRPYIGVRTARNAKGISLFARALLSRYRMYQESESAAEARTLLDWLIANAVPDSDYLSWGYPYPWQDVGFFAPRHFPNRVVTSFVTEALIDGFETLGESRYLDAAKASVRFLLEAPRVLYEDEQHLCLSYVPSESVNWIVMDVSALAGAVAARLASIMNDASLMKDAARLVRYVISKQTEYAAWYYSEPPGASHIRHDNYHTGFILDAIADYSDYAQSEEFDDNYRRGLAFYQEHLFESNGAPRFMNDKRYPYDIHGAAQGIITFARAQARRHQGKEISRKILAWTLDNMYSQETGWFYYQKRRLFRSPVRLLRWCQGWMAWAIACHLEHCGEES